MLSLNIGQGDEIIAGAYNCISIFNAILSVGATPVLADISPNNLCISSLSIQDKITSKTKAIIVTHLFGAKADVIDFMVDIPIIEDFSHGIFRQTACLGIASHGPTKLINSCSGGIVSGDEHLINCIRDLRDCSDKPISTKQNDMPNDLSAAVALEQLRRLPGIKNKRAMAAARYDEWIHDFGLAEIELISRQTNSPYRFCIRLENHLAGDISTAMKTKGVCAEVPVWDYRMFQEWPRDLPECDQAFLHTLSLPFFESITQEEQTEVVRALGECLND